jgi:glycosyltransferase involved in cell wall biosynthesis
MICGAAVVATDIGGHHEYAVGGETALVVPPKDPSALATAIVRMVTDNALRYRLAGAGNALIRQFTWERACEKFERILHETLYGNQA